jgi:iron complex transport system permease protein
MTRRTGTRGTGAAPTTGRGRASARATAGGGTRILRIGDAVSLPYTTRQLVVVAAAACAILLVGVLTLTLGRLGLPVGALLPTSSGLSTSQQFVLERLRGPRLVVAVGAGAAFGVSGALFQTVTRNPLGSPDVIGLGFGAGAGAAVVALLLPGSLPIPVGALLGSVVAIVLVYLGTGRGFGSPSRVIIVGIGVSAMATAVTQYAISRAGREQATVVAAYLNGSLASRSWTDAAVIGATLAVLLPLSLLVARRLALVEMGDELADALGARSRGTRTSSILIAVGLSAAAVSVAGPIAFVALTAPQIGRRLTRRPGAGVLVAALVGAVVLTTADLLVQQSPLPVQLPVGVLTAVLGGAYLAVLLAREWRRGAL